jgi:phage terminase small subunit
VSTFDQPLPEQDEQLPADIDSLEPRQRRFVEEYLVDLNATRAAIRAGYSAKSARTQGPYLLSNPVISTAISVEQSRRSKRTGITADRVLAELAALAFSDVTEVVDWNGEALQIRSSKEMPRRVKRAIESITEKPTPFGTSRSVKMHSKTTALKMLMDHLGLNKPLGDLDKDEEGLPVSLTIAQLLELAAAGKRGE